MSVTDEERPHRRAAFLAAQENLQKKADEFLSHVYAVAKRQDKDAPLRQVELGAGVLLDAAVFRMKKHLGLVDLIE